MRAPDAAKRGLSTVRVNTADAARPAAEPGDDAVAELSESPSSPRTASSARAPTRARASRKDFEFTLDPDWRITSITKAAADWCGSTVEALLGRNGREVNPAATTMLGEAIEAAFRGKTSTMEQPSTHVPGRWVKVEVAPAGGGARIRFEDITAKFSDDDVGSLGGELGPAEIVLIDQRGIIVAANAAWRAAVVAHGLELANAGVGARYADVGKAAVKDVNEANFEKDLADLLSGRETQFSATYSLDSPDGGHELRRVRIAPLRIGETTFFAAIHEDLTERAKILATLHETSDQLLHAQESERQRIAIELHDSMSQHLAGLVMGLAQLRLRAADERSQTLIDEMAKLSQLAIRETRVLSYLMNAAGDEDDGLELSVRRFVEGFGRRTGLRMTFGAEGPLDSVSPGVRHTLFRVTQEALSNVYRHARATSVSVSLANRAGAITVRIQDDGRGIQRPPGAGFGEALLGVGIAGMRARIEQLGGNLDIDGRSGGTIVTATIPLRTPRPALAATG